MKHKKIIRKQKGRELIRWTEHSQSQARGSGYVRVKDREETIEIDPKFLNTGLHGDQVRVLIVGKNKEGKRDGRD